MNLTLVNFSQFENNSSLELSSVIFLKQKKAGTLAFESFKTPVTYTINIFELLKVISSNQFFL